MDKQELQDMKEYRDPLTEKLAELEKEGYEADFKLQDGKLALVDGDKSFSANELTIKEDFRFEGESNPDDLSILYAPGGSGRHQRNCGTRLWPRCRRFA